MNITFYNTASENERVTKVLTQVLSLNGTLREESDVMSPSIVVQADTSLLSCNYAYITEFGRYYFIDNITSIRNGIWLVKMHIDVLMTYDSAIRGLYAVVVRQESKQSSYLIDNKIPLQAKETTQTFNFPNAFSKSLYYVLAVAGG